MIAAWYDATEAQITTLSPPPNTPTPSQRPGWSQPLQTDIPARSAQPKCPDSETVRIAGQNPANLDEPRLRAYIVERSK